jgi:hyperosmotically inducible periplasmic protein
MHRLKHGILAACLVTGLAAVGACNKGPDPSDNATRALKNANLDDVKVDWDKDARVAHLKGTVDRPADRQRAEDVAAAAVGTTGRVLNEVTVKNVDEKSADDNDGRIRSDLKKLVDADPVLRDRSIDFDVNNGVVTVKGDVRTAREKQQMTDLVKTVPGIKDMANALEIKPGK